MVSQVPHICNINTFAPPEPDRINSETPGVEVFPNDRSHSQTSLEQSSCFAWMILVNLPSKGVAATVTL